ncbi:hypothetical protein L596_025159 [Steinernema carpocapsae]|uniref:Uncharacterized protein n=1 Tax=Steinernema carpocapsae TaxID=34508 RepID=A0A4V6XVR7_STECR|nr:hypothetical protein L596_025159 [Steinernema carpocapsae]
METTTPATPPADSPKSLGTALAAITLADDASEDEFEWTERKPESQKRSLPSHPTGFWLFANAHFGQSVTKKKDFHGSNRVFLNATFGKLKNKITECAQPLWNKMTEEEKKVSRGFVMRARFDSNFGYFWTG